MNFASPFENGVIKSSKPKRFIELLAEDYQVERVRTYFIRAVVSESTRGV